MLPSRLFVLCSTIFALAPAGSLQAQRLTRPPAEYVVEVVTQFRQMGDRQQPRFTPFRETRYASHIDARDTDSLTGNTTWSLRFEPATYVDSAYLITRRDGSVADAFARARLFAPSPVGISTGALPSPSDNSYVDRTLTFVHSYMTLMPQARLWRFVPVIRGELRTGATWRDTLRFSSTENGFGQTLTGPRISTVIRDTVVQGRTLWIIRDSAAVQVAETLKEMEYSVSIESPIVRTLSGFIRGRYVYDPQARLALQRYDTTQLTGSGTLSYPDGRSFTTSLRQESRQQMKLFTGTEYAAYQAELRAAQARARTGMLILPNTRDQQRLAAGDVAFRDSLASAWETSQDPDERARLFSLLSSWGNRTDTTFGAALARRAFAAGDTVTWLDHLARSSLEARSWDLPTIRDLLLPILADPATALSFGVSRDRFYEAAARQLLENPPAITQNQAQWGFPNSVYDLFAAMWRESREPRLRALALLANVARNPRVWGDSLLANLSLSPFILNPAAQLLRGVGATWPAASQQPMPPSAATWRDWLEWMGGRNPNYVVPASVAARSNPRYPELRFEQSHVKAIRFFSARTGRDIAAELIQANAVAAEDSAKLVYATMLATLGAIPLDASELAREVISGSPLMLQHVRRTLPQMFAESMRGVRAGPPLPSARLVPGAFAASQADSALTTVMFDRLIESLLSGSQPWAPVEARIPGIGAAAPGSPGSPQGTLTLMRDAVPAAVIEKWRSRATFLTQAEVAALDPRRERRVYVLSPVFVAGPFAVVSYNYRDYVARAADEAPAGYAGGTTLYLMFFNNEWIVITQSGWVT